MRRSSIRFAMAGITVMSALLAGAVGATADGLATLVMVLGPARGRALLEDLPGCEGYLVTKQLEVVRTSDFRVIGA